MGFRGLGSILNEIHFLMKNLITVLTLLSLSTLKVVAAEDALPMRFSGDYSLFCLYLSKDLALIKHTFSYADGRDVTSFAIVKAHYVGPPDNADITGDTSDKIIAIGVKRICLDDSQKLIFVVAEEANSNTAGKKNTNLAISVTTGTVYTEADLSVEKDKLKIKWPANGLGQLEPVQIFFDKTVVSRLDPLHRKQ